MKLIIISCDTKNGETFSHNGVTINFVSHPEQVV